MRKGFAVAFPAALTLALIAAACGNFLGLSEAEAEKTDLDPDSAIGEAGTDADPFADDGASGSQDAASVIDGETDADAGLILWTDGAAASCSSCASGSCRTDGGCDPAVFITKQMFNGSLPVGGGVIGAEKGDKLCNEAKLALGIPGDFRAWLSNGAEGPASDKRFPKRSTRPYRLLNGNLVADNFTQLTATVGGGPKIAINYSEANTTVPANEPVWTGTVAAGTPAAARCTFNFSDWSSVAQGIKGTYGFADPNDLSTWSVYGDGACAANAHLYCFEQQW